MKRRTTMLLLRVIALSMATVIPVRPSSAQGPDLGGEMKHIEVRLVETELRAEVDPLVATPVLRDSGVAYAGGASVLNGSTFNAQYGWTVGGFWAPPIGAFVYIEQIDATPGLRVYAQGTYAPIFSTGGSSPRIRWNGAMLHNWYSTTTPGPHEATYLVYFGDAAATPLIGYQAATVTLHFQNELDTCPADFNGDTTVDVLDFLDFLNAFSACDAQQAPCPDAETDADINGDTTVDILDFLDFINEFSAGTCA